MDLVRSAVEPVFDRRTITRRGRRLQYADDRLELGGVRGRGRRRDHERSVALVGFGVDSAIEVLSSAAALWRLGSTPITRPASGRNAVVADHRRLLLALAAYVAWDALASLTQRQAPEVSRTGLVLAALSLVVMPTLVVLKRRVPARSRAARSRPRAGRRDLRVSVRDLLGGLALNATSVVVGRSARGLAMTPLDRARGVAGPPRGDVLAT
jgi:hypothetical protein